MNVEVSPNGSHPMLAKGRRIFFQLAIASLLLGAIVTLEEIVNFLAPAILIIQILIFLLVGLIWWLMHQGHALRWLLFCLLLFAGAFTFLLGGLHMTDIQEGPIDPICYWLVAGGLAFLGMGGYSAYSPELDMYFRHLTQKRMKNEE